MNLIEFTEKAIATHRAGEPVDLGSLTPDERETVEAHLRADRKLRSIADELWVCEKVAQKFEGLHS